MPRSLKRSLLVALAPLMAQGAILNMKFDYGVLETEFTPQVKTLDADLVLEVAKCAAGYILLTCMCVCA